MLSFGHGRRGTMAGCQAKLPRLSMLPDQTGWGGTVVGGDNISSNLRGLTAQVTGRPILVVVCQGDPGSIALEALGLGASGQRLEGLHRSGLPAILPIEGRRQGTRPCRDPVEGGARKAHEASAGRVTRKVGVRRMGEPPYSRITRISGGKPAQ